ncbi:hypothetical protein BASA83_002761 [Batrachochytrium salamandrivorans]|nr:hypothetical protein BASA83_002761 [Batrachochytrium salamandrivorans]
MIPRYPTMIRLPTHSLSSRTFAKTSIQLLTRDSHLGITDAFAMIRGRHTRLTNMAPYDRFIQTTEVEFAFIEGSADIINKPTVCCDFYLHIIQTPLLLPEGLLQDPSWNELLAINGLSFIDWFKQNKFKFGAGANDIGGQRAGLE